MANNNHIREILLHKLEALNTICRTTAEAASTVELDQSRVGRLSRMDALQAQSMSQESQRRDQLEHRKIEAALKRIEGSEFGTCFECGEEIALQRLELNPTATLCIVWATKKEERC